MLNIGFGEILVIAILLLIVVGPEKLPPLLRKAGEHYARLRRAAWDLQNAFMEEGDLLDAGRRGPGAQVAHPSPRAPAAVPAEGAPAAAAEAGAAEEPAAPAAPAAGEEPRP